MNTKNRTGPKALVTVLEDIETAHAIVEKLHRDGFELGKVEIITRDVHKTAPEIETPYASETMETSMITGGIQGAKLGVGIGLLGALVVPFPGVGLAMIAMGGMVGGAFGAIAGSEHGREDDATDLPKIDEYEQLVKDGYCLVVVTGTHDEVQRAADSIEGITDVHHHLHRLAGHDYHEHPSHKVQSDEFERNESRSSKP